MIIIYSENHVRLALFVLLIFLYTHATYWHLELHSISAAWYQ